MSPLSSGSFLLSKRRARTYIVVVVGIQAYGMVLLVRGVDHTSNADALLIEGPTPVARRLT